MYKFLVFIMLILGSCTVSTSPVEEVPSTGLVGLPQFVYFVSSNIGYSFSNVRTWNENSSHPREDCAVFKTIDGGRSWNELCNIHGASFSPIYTTLEQAIYVVCSFREGHRIIKWDVSKDSITTQSGNLPAISYLWTQDSLLFFTSSRKPSKFYSMSLNLEHERSIESLNGYILGCSTNIRGSLCIFSNKGKKYLAVLDGMNISKIINIPNFSPLEIISYDDDTMLIIGNDCHNQKAMVVSFHMITNKFETYNFENYNIIRSLVKYGDRCVCLLGNEKGHFVEYSLGYLEGIDSSWHIIGLRNNKRCVPISLIDNRCYLYGGPNMFQEVLL